MKDMVITLKGYNTACHIYIVADGQYLVTINRKVTNIGGATLKGVIANARRAIKRRG